MTRWMTRHEHVASQAYGATCTEDHFGIANEPDGMTEALDQERPQQLQRTHNEGLFDSHDFEKNAKKIRKPSLSNPIGSDRTAAKQDPPAPTPGNFSKSRDSNDQHMGRSSSKHRRSPNIHTEHNICDDWWSRQPSPTPLKSSIRANIICVYNTQVSEATLLYHHVLPY